MKGLEEKGEGTSGRQPVAERAPRRPRRAGRMGRLILLTGLCLILLSFLATLFYALPARRWSHLALLQKAIHAGVVLSVIGLIMGVAGRGRPLTEEHQPRGREPLELQPTPGTPAPPGRRATRIGVAILISGLSLFLLAVLTLALDLFGELFRVALALAIIYTSLGLTAIGAIIYGLGRGVEAIKALARHAEETTHECRIGERSSGSGKTGVGAGAVLFIIGVCMFAGAFLLLLCGAEDMLFTLASYMFRAGLPLLVLGMIIHILRRDR